MPTLDWLNRASAFNTAARVPYRLLEQVSVHTPTAPLPSVRLEVSKGQPELTTVRPEPVEGSSISTSTARSAFTDNLLIQGRALQALQALLPFYRSQVACMFVDQPYNIKTAFEHFDDDLDHTERRPIMPPLCIGD